MAIKLIATDMDRTFLDKQHHFDVERLAKVAEKGIYFVVAKGRSRGKTVISF